MTTYYTKCGRQFEKSTKAETTGYHLEEDESGNIFDMECTACPFPVDVKDGYGANEKHKRYECRAGSERPNHENSWGGDLSDKTTLRVYSLDHNFCESVIAFARNHTELSASYNQDCSDCRRTVSVSCSQNKAGIAAKRELIEKFFPDHEVEPDPTIDPDDLDDDGVDYGDTEAICECCGKYKPIGPDVGNCVIRKHVVSRVRPACEDYGPGEAEEETLIAEANRRRCGSCNCGHWYSAENTCVNVVQDDGIHTIQRPCKPHTHYCYQFAEGQREIAEDKDFDPDSAPGWCPMSTDATAPTLKVDAALLQSENLDDEPEGMDSDDQEPESVRKPRCPFLSAVGSDYVNCCAPGARILQKKTCEDPKAFRDMVDEKCFNRFLNCEDYRRYYADPSVVNPDHQKCAFCCNSSGYTGLDEEHRNQVDSHGCIYAFCQKHQKPVERFTDNDLCEWFNRHPYWTLPRSGSKGCEEMREDCSCFCAHNDGCAVLIMQGSALTGFIEQCLKTGGVDCDVFWKVAERVRETRESVIETTETVTEQPEFVSDAIKPVEVERSPGFDYSQVDEQTADFLQEKAKNISEIKVRTVFDIGLELSLAHDALANHKNGLFGAWCGSVGISLRTAENYIQAYEYIAKNFRNIEDAANIQPSLLFAASKPSAPPELAQAVVDGDITKHKDFIKAMEELKDAKEKLAEAADKAKKDDDAFWKMVDQKEKEEQKVEELKQ